MVVFPESVVCVLEDGYENTAVSKQYHGKRSYLFNPVIDVIFAFNNYEAVQAMYLFYSQILNNSRDPFVIRLPVFGFEDRYIVRLESPMSWASIAGATGQMKAKLRIVTPLKALSDADYEMDINVLDSENTTDFGIYVEASDGTEATLWILGDMGFKRIENIQEDGQTITIHGNNKIYGLNIDRFKINSNSVVHDVNIYRNEKQTTAEDMFKDNKELVEIKASGYTFANVTTLREFARSCSKLERIDSFDTHNVENWYRAFNWAETLKFPDLYYGSGTDFYETFYGCRGLENIPEIHLYEAITVESMFQNTTRYLDGEQGTIYIYKECDCIDMFNSSETEYGRYQLGVVMFEACNCSTMFYSMSGCTRIHIEMQKPASGTYKMFTNSDNITCIYGRLDTTEADNKDYMFDGCDSLTTPDQTTQDDLVDGDGAIWENDSCS